MDRGKHCSHCGGNGVYWSFRFWQLYQQIKSEYETIRVVQMVDDYVNTHGGGWPSSWEDLDGTRTAKQLAPLDSSYFRRYTTVDFVLTAEQLIDDPALIYDAVRRADTQVRRLSARAKGP